MYRSLAAQGSIPKSYSAMINLSKFFAIERFGLHDYSATSPILWVSNVEMVLLPMVLLPKVLKVKSSGRVGWYHKNGDGTVIKYHGIKCINSLMIFNCCLVHCMNKIFHFS